VACVDLLVGAVFSCFFFTLGCAAWRRSVFCVSPSSAWRRTVFFLSFVCVWHVCLCCLTLTIASIFKHLFYCLPIYLKYIFYLSIIFSNNNTYPYPYINKILFFSFISRGLLSLSSPLLLNQMVSEERNSYLYILSHSL
jgi:hypothetical protein